jgi:hypothetical protein
MLLLSSSLLFSCRVSREAASEAPQSGASKPSAEASYAGPPTIVYKTIADYYDRVPVIMNEARTEIVSYPDPTDVGDFSLPTRLKDGYLLDNRGINERVAFLRYTYNEYGRLPHVPSVAELKANILELYPLLEIINCGVRYRYKNEVEELNALIDSGFAGWK